MTEKGEPKSALETELQHTGPRAKEIYLKLLGRLRVERTKAAHGRAEISEEDKLRLLNEAQGKAANANVDTQQMENDWKFYNQRPPIGGAQDD